MKKLITAGCVLTLCGLLALLGFYGYAYLSYVPLLGQVFLSFQSNGELSLFVYHQKDILP